MIEVKTKRAFAGDSSAPPEEHALWHKESAGEVSEAERARLRSLQITLDKCWDFLNQRRALRDAGRNPDEAKVRDPNVVERYVG